MSEMALFCRIAWMEHYTGVVDDPMSPQHGGQWVEDGNVPWESYNFKPFGNKIYGYARPGTHWDRARLERIDPTANCDRLGGVRVVFFSQGPSGQVIVGWYSNATVLREAQRGPGKLRDDLPYMFICAADQAVLLPPNQRNHSIPRGKGATGQSNWTYTLEDDGTPKKSDWIKEAVKYTKEYDSVLIEIET
jgi:hypothetical protein